MHTEKKNPCSEKHSECKLGDCWLAIVFTTDELSTCGPSCTGTFSSNTQSPWAVRHPPQLTVPSISASVFIRVNWDLARCVLSHISLWLWCQWCAVRSLWVFLFFFFLIYLMYECSAAYTSACQKRTSDPFIGGCEPNVVARNSGPLEAQPMLLTTEPSHQPRMWVYKAPRWCWWRCPRPPAQIWCDV